MRKDRARVFRWYFQAATHGLLRAQLNVGLCYRDGDGVKASNHKPANGGRLLDADMLRRVTS